MFLRQNTCALRGAAVRFFCDAGARTPSKAATLRSIHPDKLTLQHLDSIKLGYVSKRRARVALAKRKEQEAANPTGYQGGKTKEEKANNRENRASREKRQFKADGKIVDAMPLQLSRRPYPFNMPGRALVRLEKADDIRTSFTTPEVAVIGRSNVGKSTLVNNLLGFTPSYVQKSEVSSKPGHTQMLHLFALGGKREHVQPSGEFKVLNKAEPTRLTAKVYKAGAAALVLCDMPGYGFAYMADEQRQRCDELVNTYLTQRGRSLKRVLLLIDARHGLKSVDVQFLQQLNELARAATSTNTNTSTSTSTTTGRRRWPLQWKLQIVLTKSDLLERTDLAKRLMLVRRTLAETVPSRMISELPVIPLSGLANKGLESLMADLVSLVPDTHQRPSPQDLEQQFKKDNHARVKEWQPWPTEEQRGTQKMPPRKKERRHLEGAGAAAAGAAAGGPNRKERRRLRKERRDRREERLAAQP